MTGIAAIMRDDTARVEETAGDADGTRGVKEARQWRGNKRARMVTLQRLETRQCRWDCPLIKVVPRRVAIAVPRMLVSKRKPRRRRRLPSQMNPDFVKIDDVVAAIDTGWSFFGCSTNRALA